MSAGIWLWVTVKSEEERSSNEEWYGFNFGMDYSQELDISAG